MATPKAQAPIIIKKKGGHGGHHGGAWKVAYADFVTAMMALFIVLWLLSSSVKVQKAVGGYFRDPSGTADLTGSSMAGMGEAFVLNKDNMEKLKDELTKAIKEIPKFEELKNHIDMTVTNEGLRIELTESAAGTFFDSGSAKISADGASILSVLADQLGKLPNKIAMEGHTDSRPYGAGASYGNWELSADRANAARRLMQKDGIREDQVTQVRGFADQKLRKPDAPMDPSNRRISLIVLYLASQLKVPADEKDTATGKEGKPGEKGETNEKGEKPAGEKSAAGEKPADKPAEKSSEKPSEKSTEKK